MPGPQLNVDVILTAKNGTEIANEVGRSLSKVAKEWRDEVKGLMGTAVADATQFAFASGQAGSAMKKFVKDNLTGPYLEFRKAVNAEDAAAAHKHHKRLKQKAKDFKRELDAMGAAYERVQQRKDRTGAQRVDAFAGAAQGLRGGAGGIMGLLRGGGGGLADIGKARQQEARDLASKAEKMKGPGAKAGAAQAAQMAKMGQMIAKIGTAVATFAAVAAAVLVLIKLFADLEGKMKDMNKALIASAGAADFGLGHAEIMGGKLRDMLEDLRSQTTALNDNFMKFRASAQEQQSILATFNQAGLTYARMNEQIKQGTKFMKSYSDVTALALTYSRNLGVESGEITQRMGMFTLETGANVTEIAEGFSIIQREAMLAGFVTKRFYSTIVEVTSGMAFYGVRIEETAKVLSNLDKLMGEALGPEMMRELVGKGKEMGPQERLREIILKDPEYVADQYAKAFARKNQELSRDFADDLGKFLQEGETLEDFLTLSGPEIRKRLAGVMGAPEIERFTQAAVLRRAGEEDVGAMQRGRGFAGPGLDLALAASATRVFGGKRIDEVFADIAAGRTTKEAGFAALAEVTQMSFAQLEKMNTLLGNATANLSKMRDIAVKEPTQRTEAEKKFLQDMEAAFDATIDESTHTIMRGDLKIEDAVDFASGTTVDTSEELEKQMTKDQEIATEISRNITGLNQIMEQTIAGILNEIYNVLVAIANVVTADTGEAARVAATEAARAARLEALSKSEEALEKELKAQRTLEEARETEDAEQIALAKKELKEAKQQTDNTTRELVSSEAAEKAAQDLGDAQIDEQGAGFHAVVDAVERATGEQKFASKGQQKQFATALEATLPRLTEDIRDPGFFDLAGDFEKALALDPVFGMDPDDFASKWIEKVLADPEMTKMLGGEEAVRSIAERSQTVMEKHEDWGDLFWTPQNREELAAAFSSAVGVEVAAALPSPEQQRAADEKMRQELKDIATSVQTFGMGAFFGRGTPTQDTLILPDSGPPLLPDVGDTIIAAKPGGPIAAALGGGGGGPVNINIYGGDQKKVYDTIMRVMKAMGHA